MATTQQVQQLYIGLLGRAADQAGLNFWINDIASGHRTLADVQKAFATSPEFAATYGAITDRAALVDAIYVNLFERAPDAAGKAYWVGTNLTADQLIAGFLEHAAPADRTVLNNKVQVAEVYTAVAGGAATFKVADATKVVADVNGTQASVNAAIGSLGTLPGASFAAIKALEVATANQVAFETNKANLDALVALNTKAIAVATAAGVTPIPAEVVDGTDDGNVAGDSWAEVSSVASAAFAVRGSVSTSPTNVLQANADNAAGALAAAKQTLGTVTNGTALVNAYDAAAAAALASKATAAAVKNAAVVDLQVLVTADSVDFIAALPADARATGALPAPVTDAATLYDYLAAPTTTAAQITAVSNAINNATSLNATLKFSFAAAAKLAAADRVDAQNDLNVNTAAANLAAAASDGNPATTTALETAVADYTSTTPGTSAFYNNAAAQKTLADAKAADALKAEADALLAAHKAVTDAVATALTAASASGAIDLDANKPGTATAEVFYFKDPILTADDFTVGFTKGDSLHVGSGLTFNNGALSTGNNNALEFFLVKNGANTNVVIETKAFGSATTIAAADGTIATTTGSPDAAVITLTGVTLEQLSVNNGVVTWA